jgi:ABC-2 type transport system ATP-binding protein
MNARASTSSVFAIEAEGLDKKYGKDVQALRDLSFRVERGTIFALLGPNGAGKSTAVKILTTMARPDAGRARVAGIDVVANPQAVRRVIGCVAQKDAVDLEATGRENITLQGQLYGMTPGDVHRRADELLEHFQLTQAASRVSRTYSGGMRRKLSVAMGLIHRPEVLFLDEPTTGLDPEARSGLWSEVHRLATQDGISVLLTTHYLDEADHLADAWRSSTRAGSSPRERPTSSRASFAATQSTSSSTRMPPSTTRFAH